MQNSHKHIESVAGLKLTLGSQELAVLTHYSGGKNILVFSPNYLTLPVEQRHPFTLTQLAAPAMLQQPLVSHQKLTPLLSNLLPEGALREWMATSLKVHTDNEFPLFAHMSHNLPGALRATPISAGELPDWALDHRRQIESIQIDIEHTTAKFSLAGVQMKFSSTKQDGRFNLKFDADGESWIIKTPSTIHKNVPENEYTAMRLAQAAGVVIPDIQLVERDRLDHLPDIQLPNETYAYAIKRFDRGHAGRIHTEDFAQIFQVYPNDKYKKFNYEQIGSALFQHSATGLADVQQMARRLLVNILLGNGDAHLKNWSLIYRNKLRPQLSPAYDIVFTLPYVAGDDSVALKMAKQNNFYSLDYAAFETWSKRMQVPWPAIKVHLQDTLERARDQWPQLLSELPMLDAHKQALITHWQRLHPDFHL
ncbi:type II toxin-antitoxin system HipA family toxin [Pseudidiomarina sp. E22-M8]|uniref:type II toxin-antitoxin system HipA family toxin n=1 Tax=Pseudidiomarina sp. E22-M8 TaxID=3424768 RepID=UPI00403C862E